MFDSGTSLDPVDWDSLRVQEIVPVHSRRTAAVTASDRQKRISNVAPMFLLWLVVGLSGLRGLRVLFLAETAH